LALLKKPMLQCNILCDVLDREKNGLYKDGVALQNTHSKPYHPIQFWYMESDMSEHKHKNSSKAHGGNKSSVQAALHLQSEMAKSKSTVQSVSQVKGQEKMSVVAKTQVESGIMEKHAEEKVAPRLVASTASAAPAVTQKSEVKSEAKKEEAANSAIANTATGLISAGTTALSEMVSASSSQAQKAQEKAVAVVREGADHVSRSAQAATRSLDEAISISHEQIEAIMKSTNLAGDTARKLMDELFSYTNEVFARNVEISREVFSCRTINDALDLQNKIIQTNVDGLLNEASKISEMMFDYATQAVDPIGERVSEVMDRITKSIAA